MRLRTYLATGIACVAGLCASGAAAQTLPGLDFVFNTASSAAPPGNPQVFPTTPTGSFGGGGPITIYNLEPENSGGQSFIVLTGSLPPPPPGVMLTGNQFAGEFSYTSADLISRFDPAMTNPKPFRYRAMCQLVPTVSGAPAGTAAQFCDELDAVFRFGGLELRMSAAENSPAMNFEIPALGIDFDSVGAVNRSQAREQFFDFLDMRGQADIAALLYGLPGGQSVPVGVLPTGGSLFAFDGVIRRSGNVLQPGAEFDVDFGFQDFGQLLGFFVANRGLGPADFGLAGLSYNETCQRTSPGGPVDGFCDEVDATLTVLGVEVVIDAAEDDPDVTFTVPDIGYSYTSEGALTRGEAFLAFADDLEAEDGKDRVGSAILANLMAENPEDGLVGNPVSIQGVILRAGLDLSGTTELDAPGPESDLATEDDDGDEQSGGSGRRSSDAGWMIGGRAGVIRAGASEGDFLEGLAERSFAVGEGSRARLKLSIPFSYLDIDGIDPQTSASIRIGYERPLIEGRWVMEPSIAAGYVFETMNLSAGALYSLGLSNRFKIAPVGKGHIIIGSAVNYSSTLEIDTGAVTTPVIQNTSFRNGIAYQLPVGQRIADRLGTVRASYTHTQIEGDPVFLDQYHDVSLSYGIGSREASVRQRAEVLRLGLTGTFGTDFEAVSAVLGYLF